MKVELIDILQKLLAVHNIQVTEYTVPFNVENLDGGFRNTFYRDFDWNLLTDKFSGMMKEKVMYIVCDYFGAYYITFVPDLSLQSFILIGPYRLTGIAFDDKQYSEKGFNPAEINVIKQYILSIPHIHEDVVMQQIAAVFSVATGINSIEIKHIKENFDKHDIYNHVSFVFTPDNNAFPYDKIENRYKVENEILDAVSQGNLTKVKRMMKAFPIDDIGERYTSLHLLKNTLIIFNTLMRKAVEKANVHPYYLDEISYRFFQKIEFVNDRSQQAQLMNEMIKGYCDYAKRYSVEKYSPVVQKALNYIQINITSKLTLDEIANECKVSASHLARVFRSETGRSIIDFINYTRITIAANKLKETNFSISEISAAVGILDTNYFSRLFKKYIGCSPAEYRR